VRARRGDEILLTTYGRSSGFCIDLIEKKPLPGTPVLSIGTAGCNLTCKFCQNWDISKARSHDRRQSEAAPETIVHAAQATGSRAIAYAPEARSLLDFWQEIARNGRDVMVQSEGAQAGELVSRGRVLRADLLQHGLDWCCWIDLPSRLLCSCA
jgi:pyruvate formate lyase activating enzyme